MSLFSCLVKDTKCWEHGESDWVPDRGKQPLHFPGSFLGTGVRYFSKVGVAPPVAASCLPSPRKGQSSSKAAPCRTEQREQGIAVGSPCIPLALEELCSEILQASKLLPRGVWEEISSARGGHTGGCVWLWLLWIRSAAWTSTGLWPAGHGWGACLQSLPQSPRLGSKAVSVLGRGTFLAGVEFVWLFPRASRISEELQQLAGGSRYCGSSVTLTCFLQADAKKYSMSVSADTEDRLCLSNGEFQKQTEELPSYIMLASWHLCKTTQNCLLPLPESKPQPSSRRGLKPWSATHCKFLISNMLSGRGDSAKYQRSWIPVPWSSEPRFIVFPGSNGKLMCFFLTQALPLRCGTASKYWVLYQLLHTRANKPSWQQHQHLFFLTMQNLSTCKQPRADH